MEIIYDLEKLSNDELFYLKLFTHNYTDQQIAEFLCVGKKQVDEIELNLRKKLKTKDCVSTIVKAFEYGILDKYDFVHELVKIEAIKITSRLEFHFQTGEIDENIIRREVSEMLKNANSELKKYHEKNLNVKDITEVEKRYLKLMFEGHNRFDIIKELKASSAQVFHDFKKSTFKKLQVNCFYNAYRKAFELQMLIDDKKNTHQRTEVRKIVKAINESLQEQGNRVFEKEKIYRLLIKCFNNINYKLLHKKYRNIRLILDQ